MSSLQRRLARYLYRWHRLLGAAAALFILLLAITGVMLNHSNELGLDRHHVTLRPLLAWYGIKPPEQVPYFAAGTHYISQWDDHLLFDSHDIGAQPGKLRGAVALHNLIVVALDERLLLILDDGRLLDIIDEQTELPTPLLHIGLTPNGSAMLATPHGLFVGNRDLTDWAPSPLPAPQWSQTSTPPEPVRRAAETYYLGAGLPLERVIEDLHSGRLFTRHGPWLMDMVALILIFSTVSGVWLWWRNHLRSHRH